MGVFSRRWDVPTSELFLCSEDEKCQLCDLLEGFGREQDNSIHVSGIWRMWKEILKVSDCRIWRRGRFTVKVSNKGLFCRGTPGQPVTLILLSHSSLRNRKQSNNSTPAALTNCFLVLCRVPRVTRGRNRRCGDLHLDRFSTAFVLLSGSGCLGSGLYRRASIISLRIFLETTQRATGC